MELIGGSEDSFGGEAFGGLRWWPCVALGMPKVSSRISTGPLGLSKAAVARKPCTPVARIVRAPLPLAERLTRDSS